MQQPQLSEVAKALTGLILAATKLENLLHSVSDTIIHEENAGESSAPVIQDSPMPTPESNLPDLSQDQPVAAEPSGELDGEGRPWVQGIHVDSKSQVNSKFVKGVKAWRLKKNVDQAELQAFYDKYPINQGSNDKPSVTPGTPAGPGTPNLPGTPAGPGTPSLPGSPVVEQQESPEVIIRREVMALLMSLINDYGLSWDDLKEIMTVEFKVAQNDVQVSFGGLTYAQFPQVKEYFEALLAKYSHAASTIKEIYTIAGGANKSVVDNGLVEIFKPANTDQLAGVHYSQIGDVCESIKAWSEQWKAWKAGS